MKNNIDIRRIGIFLAFAFGIAWAVGLVIYLTGGVIGSPEVIPGTGFTLAYLLAAFGYMSAPALAHVLTRVVTREGWQGSLLRPNLRRGWRFYLAAWFLPLLLTIIGGVLYYLIFPGHYTSKILEQLSATMAGINPWLLVIVQTLAAALIAPLINSFFTFGEEFGWRSYLLTHLMPLGAQRAMLVMGVIWGVWHWPMIAMGHNYGLNYPGAPWTGMLMMVWFSVMLSVFISWVTLRSGSVWAGVLAHAAVNGVAGLALVFADSDAIITLLGPSPAGLIGGLGFTVLALALFFHPRALRAIEPAGPAAVVTVPSAAAAERAIEG